ncbi:MAG: hypothetical protein IPK71_00485 [Myxococcales bacterium]|nr:hypothetical protein [Myxococcales bacterium]
MAHSPEEPRDGDPADEDRNAILRRRGAFVSAALAAVAGGAMLSVACSPEPCLQCPLSGCSDDRPLVDASVAPDADATAPDASDAAAPDASDAAAPDASDAAAPDAGDAGGD